MSDSSDLIWRFAVDLERLRSVWPDNAAELSVRERNYLWRPDAFRRLEGRLVPNQNALRLVHVKASHGGIKSREFPDEDDPVLEQIDRARRIDVRLSMAGRDAREVLQLVYRDRMSETRTPFGWSTVLASGDEWRELRGAGNLAHLCPAAATAWKLVMIRRAHRKRVPLEVWLDSFGDRLLRAKGDLGEVSTGRAIARWCDAELSRALARYGAREAA